MSRRTWTQEEITLVIESGGVPAAVVGATLGRTARSVTAMRSRLRAGAPTQLVVRLCSIEGCEVKHSARGWCSRHLKSWRLYGDPMHPIRKNRERPADGLCIAPGCERPGRPTGLECTMHHGRMMAHKSYDLPPKKKGSRLAIGYRRTDKYGYVFVFRPDRDDTHHNGYISEHRMVMADHLGRALLEDESVHHRNGIKNDNRIENLELWTGLRKQPSGQRVVDLLEWAREIVRRYDEEASSGQH